MYNKKQNGLIQYIRQIMLSPGDRRVSKSILFFKKVFSFETPVSRVTGGDTHHYTTEDNCSQFTMIKKKKKYYYYINNY
jgi:hypothetical protein